LETGEIISLVSVIAVLLFNIWTINRIAKKDNTSSGEKFGQIMNELGHQKGQLENIDKKLDSVSAAHYALSERVGKIEESTKSAHKRIDRLEEAGRKDK
jgi:peptidoglycan hydrolase CwlO-like protein